MITPAQIEYLKARGYYAEDMQAVYGDGWWNGQWRFMNSDDFGVPLATEEEAWADAMQYHVHRTTLEFEERFKRLLPAPTFLLGEAGEIFVTDDFGDLVEVISDLSLESHLYFLHFLTPTEVLAA